MTHDELLNEINTVEHPWWMQDALRAVVELHKPQDGWNDLEVCNECSDDQYEWLPCPTIRAIETALNG